MNGFDRLSITGQSESAGEAGVTGAPQISRDEIDRCIARAERLRAEQLQQWGRSVARTWGSLFRRPGRALPASMRNGKPLQPLQQS